MACSAAAGSIACTYIATSGAIIFAATAATEMSIAATSVIIAALVAVAKVAAVSRTIVGMVVLTTCNVCRTSGA